MLCFTSPQKKKKTEYSNQISLIFCLKGIILKEKRFIKIGCIHFVTDFILFVKNISLNK